MVRSRRPADVPTRLISWLSASVRPSAAVSSTRLGIVDQISLELLGQFLRLGVQSSCIRRPAAPPGQSRLPSRDRSRRAISRPASFCSGPDLFGLLAGPANLLVQADQFDQIDIEAPAPQRLRQPVEIGAENVRIYHEGRWYAGQPVGSLTMKVSDMALLVGSPSATLRLNATPS